MNVFGSKLVYNNCWIIVEHSLECGTVLFCGGGSIQRDSGLRQDCPNTWITNSLIKEHGSETLLLILNFSPPLLSYSQIGKTT